MARRSDHTREELHALILEATQEIIRHEGVAGVSTRKITGKIGYTAGTLYQVFDNLDHLIEVVNTATLQHLYEQSREFARPGDADVSLRALAGSFLDYTRAHPREWEAVIGYQFGPGHQWSDAYSQQVRNLLGLISISVAELYGESERDRLSEDVMVLWCGLYGVFSLQAANRLGEKFPPDRIIGALADMFLKMRKTAQE